MFRIQYSSSKSYGTSSPLAKRYTYFEDIGGGIFQRRTVLSSPVLITKSVFYIISYVPIRFDLANTLVFLDINVRDLIRSS